MGRDVEGVRPWRTQRDRPETQITLWEIDTYGALDAAGKPLPRRRWKVSGTKARAGAVRRTRIAELIARAAPGCEEENQSSSSQVITLREYVERDYLPYVREHHPESTWKTRRRHLKKHVLPLLGGLTLAECNTPRAVRQLRERLKSQAGIRKNSYRNLVLTSFSAVLSMAADPDRNDGGTALLAQKVRFKYLREDPLVPGSACYQLDRYRAGHHRHKRLPDDRVASLLAAARGQAARDYWHVLVGLGLFSGCRAGETCARQWDDVDWTAERLSIWSIICSETDEFEPRTKNSLPGWVPLEPSLLEALRRLRACSKSKYILGGNENGSEYLTTRNLQDRYAVIARAAGFTARIRNYHALRHTFCSRLADAGYRVEEIQRLARHKSIKTTYGYICPSETRLQSAGRALSFPLHDR